MPRPQRIGLASGMATALCILAAGCTPDYSPNTYASAAAQQANKVDQGIVVGVRPVQISADTTLATATGGAAGGIVGSGIGEGTGSAVGAVAGTVAGGVVGNVVGHAAGDTDGFEYIVKKSNGELLSVTQKDAHPLGIGAHVLLIEGAQARIVPDYTVPVVVEALHPEDVRPAPTTPQPVATPAAITPAPLPATAAAAVVSSPLPPPAQPAAEQKTEAAPAPKPDDTATPKPASGG